MSKFYSSFEGFELRNYCKIEGLCYLELIAEANRSERGKWKRYLKHILSIMRIDKKNINTDIVDINKV